MHISATMHFVGETVVTIIMTMIASSSHLMSAVSVRNVYAASIYRYLHSKKIKIYGKTELSV